MCDIDLFLLFVFGILDFLFSHLNAKLFSLMSWSFLISMVQVGHKSDKPGSYRHIFRVVNVNVTRTRIFRMYHFVTCWRCEKENLFYNIFDNQRFMCKLQNLFEKSLYKVLHIRKKRLLLQPLSRGKRAKAMTCWRSDEGLS